MNADGPLNTDRDLTDEEVAFLERETLKTARAFVAKIEELLPGLADEDPDLADRLEVESNLMLRNVEAGVAASEKERENGAEAAGGP